MAAFSVFGRFVGKNRFQEKMVMLKRWAVAASIGLLVAAGNGVAQEGGTGAAHAGPA